MLLHCLLRDFPIHPLPLASFTLRLVLSVGLVAAEPRNLHQCVRRLLDVVIRVVPSIGNLHENGWFVCELKSFSKKISWKHKDFFNVNTEVIIFDAAKILVLIGDKP